MVAGQDTAGEGGKGRAAANPAMASEVPSLAGELQTSATSLVSLVSDVLDLTRFDTGRVELNESEFQLADAVAEEVRQQTPVAAAKNLALRYEPPSIPILVRADRVKLGTYKAPSAPRPAAPKRLTLKRKGAFLALSWPRDGMAKTTLVEIRSSNGLNIARTVKRPALRLKAPPAGTRLTITLTATSRTGVLGRPGRFSRTLPKHNATKKPKTHRKAAQHR